MADYDMSIHSNPDAMAWAKFFCAQHPDCGLDEGMMFAWFANAMMAMHDHLTGAGPVVLPDGSAFFVGTVGSKDDGQ
jgi:hypothetical protein